MSNPRAQGVGKRMNRGVVNNNKQQRNTMKVGRISWKSVMEDVIKMMATSQSVTVAIRSQSDYIGLRTAAARHGMVVSKNGNEALVTKDKAVTKVEIRGNAVTQSTAAKLEVGVLSANQGEAEKPEWYVPLERKKYKEAETCSFARAVEAANSTGRLFSLYHQKTTPMWNVDCTAFNPPFEDGWVHSADQSTCAMAAWYEYSLWLRYQDEETKQKANDELTKRSLVYKTLRETIEAALLDNEWLLVQMRLKADLEYFKERIEQMTPEEVSKQFANWERTAQ